MFEEYNTINFNGIEISDITAKLRFTSKATVYYNTVLKDYLIKNWESPETVAFKVYGSCDQSWAVLLANGINNPFYDWLLTDIELSRYIEDKYDNPEAIHHYEKDGLIYNMPVIGSVPVTNFGYEHDQNEKKRKIKIILPEFLPEIEAEVIKLIKRG